MLVCRSVVSDFNMMNNFFYLTGATNLAGSLGILAVFAPSGLGVREGILTVFLSQLFTKEIVLVCVVLMRLTATITDILFFIVSKGILMVKNSVSTPSHPSQFPL